MAINLNGLGQIALEVRDVDASERFYGEVLGLRRLFRFGPLSFFDMGGLPPIVGTVARGRTN